MSDRRKDGEVSLFPPWKEAIKKFREEQFEPGKIIPTEWFWQVFGEVDPDTEASISPKEYGRRKLFFVAQLQLLQDELLEEDEIALVNVYGKGYQIIPPKDQTKFAIERAKRAIGREIRRASKTLEHIKLEQLSAAEKEENLQARSKIAALHGMNRKLPSPF